jgi:hypothetical protein
VDRSLENLRVLNFKVEIPKILRAQTFIRRIASEKLEIKYRTAGIASRGIF